MMPMNWNTLNSINQLDQIDTESKTVPIMILKHSTRCNISAMALSRMERKWQGDEKIRPYYLDLIAHRDVSGEIARRYGVEHESPQVLIIKNGQCVYTASHSSITYEDITGFAA